MKLKEYLYSKENLNKLNSMGFQKGHKPFGRSLPHVTSDLTKKKIGISNKGKKRSEKYKLKCKLKFTGKGNPNWKDGISFEPYGMEFNDDLKNYTRWMDNFTCQQCGINQNELDYRLHIHHIDFNKKNNKTNNLISLCRTCHAQTNFNRQDWTNYFQNKILNINNFS